MVLLAFKLSRSIVQRTLYQNARNFFLLSLLYEKHACILSPYGYTSNHHVCKSCMHLIYTWTYSLPSCMYGMGAFYLHMDIPTIIMYIWHACNRASYLNVDLPTTIIHVRHACILSPHGQNYYHHISMTCMHLITTWT